MEEALGPAYHRAWARQFVMAELGGRTAQEALDAGVPPKQVWAAVWRALELPGEPAMSTVADVAVIGGSGFYAFLEDAEEHVVDDAVRRPVGTGRGRHGGRAAGWRSCRGTGRSTSFPPHRINYRANLWALRSLGVRQVLRRARWAGCAPTGGARRPRRAGPARRPHQRPGLVVRRASARCTCRSPTPTARGSPTRWSPPAPRRHVAAGPWWSSRDRGSPPAPSRSGTPRRAGTLINMTGAPRGGRSPGSCGCATRRSPW